MLRIEERERGRAAGRRRAGGERKPRSGVVQFVTVVAVNHEQLASSEDIGECRGFADLPQAAREYLDFISEHSGAPVALVGVGPGRDQVLWTDAQEHRYLEEVGTMNLVARIGEEIVTPPLGGSILAGVTRDSAITLLREWGLTVNERPLGMEELLRAHRGGTLREIFGCGTAAVITPVGTLGWKGEEVVVNGGQPGEIARRLLEAITAIQYGREPDKHGWMTELDRS